MRTFYTADHHFGHESIIRLANRIDPTTGVQFASVNHMDAYMIDLWNATVAKGDRVIHVGDFAHRCDEKRMRAIFSRLHGQKFLVIGNHDDKALQLGWAAPPQHILNVTDCQSAFDWDPLSASKRDPFDRRALLVALGSSELVGVAETARARVV